MLDTLAQVAHALMAQIGPVLRDPQFWSQLVLFALISALAWLLARVMQRRQWTLPGRRWQADLSAFYFPLLALFLGRMVRAGMGRQGYFLSYFELLYKLFWVVLLFQVVDTTVRHLRPERAGAIRRSVLVPLLILGLVVQLSGLVEPLLSVLNGATLFRLGSGEGTITISLGLLLLGPLALLLLYALSQGIRSALIDDILPQVGLSESKAYAIGTLTSYFVIAIGTILVLNGLGLSPTTLTFIGSALAVGLGFGLQNTVNNMVSGLLMMFDPLMNVGDVVEVANERGTIRHIGIRNTVIEAADGTRVVMPNATLSSTPVLNLSISTRSAKQTLTVSVRNEANPATVAAAFTEVMAAHPNVRDVPAPLAQLREMDGGAFTFALTYHVKSNAEAPATLHDLSLSLLDRLHALGYELAPPTK